MKRLTWRGLLAGVLLILVAACRQNPAETVTATRLVTREVTRIVRVTPIVVTPPFIEVTAVVQPCTRMGCSDGLTVELAGELPTDFFLDLVFAADGEERQVTAQCVNGRWATAAQQGAPCEFIRLEHTPAEVMLVLTWEDVARAKMTRLSTMLKPKYEQFQPNGPECDPTCLVGTVKFEFRP